MAKKISDISVVTDLWDVIDDRVRNPSEQSYVSRLAKSVTGS